MPSIRIYHTFQRYRTLQTGKITALPVVMLMPNSSCNCRCVMCDIWKGNKNVKRLTEEDIKGLLSSLKKFGTKRVVMTGGEALLHPGFFQLCDILQKHKIRITLLSTGLTVKDHIPDMLKYIDEIIISLDGDEKIHDAIRRIPGAYRKLSYSVKMLKESKPDFQISARSVIHRYNFKIWQSVIDSAHEMHLDHISFLAADVSSHAFNREILWDESRQQDLLISREELPALQEMVTQIVEDNASDIREHFISESAEKLQKIYDYYAACHELNPFPDKRCNAPWVSTVIEADGTVKPCFFHQAIGNIRKNSLSEILNSESAIHFRRTLDIAENPVCKKCVCHLKLSPRAAI